MKRKVLTLPKCSERQTLLTARRSLKMARSAHAYVRGNTRKFYEWLDSADIEKIPRGPAVWICGDCPVVNLGPIADAEGNIDIQIRDLDQTVVGNPAHDLIRLGLSLATAARGSDLPGVTTALMMEQMMEGYEQALKPNRSKKPTDGAEDLRPIRIVLAQALKREWRHLAEERIEDVKPTI